MKELSGQEKIYQLVTDSILEKLDKGVIPWRKGWSYKRGYRNMPLNLVSKKYYRGINIILLGMQGYSSPYWATGKQINSLGGRIRKDEHGTIVIFWKWIEKEDKETGEEKRFALLRYYKVFNVEQTEGLENRIPQTETKEETEFTPIEMCELIWKGYHFRPSILHVGNQPAYGPSEDKILMPKKEQFESPEEYYSALFHEAVHSTGHRKRLNREEISGFNGFGNELYSTELYSKEELVAEFGSAFLCGTGRISPAVIENQAAYIKRWSKKIKEDRKLVIKAAGLAQKAADWILDINTHF